MDTYDAAYKTIIPVIEAALFQLGRSVPGPRVTEIATGPAYRYQEKHLQQALVLKAVRMVSALRSAQILLANGLILDAGAMMRILDEVGSDIMFIAGPVIFGHQPEARHTLYLDEFFQEEFDTSNPLTSSQKRKRVSRKDIRAYVARTYSTSQGDVKKTVEVTETIDSTFSGYIHGAAVHTMDTFDGLDFWVKLQPNAPPLLGLKDQFSHYLSRVLMGLAIAAKALGREDVFGILHRFNNDLFEDDGELRQEAP